MKVWKKLQVVFLALLLCTGMMTQPALAASLLQDGIEAALTTDKETYQQGEEIKVTLTVTNTNDTAVTNLSLENVLPENFVLAENTETTKKMESLQAGETVTLTTVCTVKASDDKKDDENKENPSGDDKKNPTDNEKPGNGNVANDTKNPGTTTGSKDSGTTLTKDQGTGNAKQNGQSLKAEKLKSAPKMGDNTKIIVWVVLLVLAGAAIVVALKKKNRRNKMLAWFLCLIMTGSTVAGVFPERARAEAQSVNIGKVMELSKNILVDQTTVELKAKVEYTYVKSDDPSDDTKTYTRGEWVQMLAEKVEMNLDTDPDSVVNDWHNNLIFIPLDIFCEYSMKALKIQNVGFNTVTVYLKDTKSVEPFIEETKNKIKIGSVDDVVQTDENGIRSSVKPMVISQQDLESGEWSYQLIRNKEWYEMVAKPVEKLNRLIGYMIVGFVTAGILLFGILTSLSVKGRKREIGILLSMGEHRKRILGQFVLENLVPVLIALVFAALCATPTAEYFADRMISNQAEKVEQENEDLSGNIKNALPTSEIAAYESTGVTVDTDLSIEWNWKIMTGMILGILDLFLLILILQVGKITRESPASILLDRK